MNYLKQFTHNGFDFLLGSDFHFKGNEWRTMVQEALDSPVEVVILPGDIIDNPHGHNVEPILEEIEDALSSKTVLTLPGNHCLRGTDHLGSNWTLTNSGIRMMGATILYDLCFLPPSILGLTDRDIIEFYQKGSDFKYLTIPEDKPEWMFGSPVMRHFDHFHTMAQEVQNQISPDIDILVTHCLPHPCQVTFRFEKITPELEELASKYSLVFISDAEYDEKKAKEWGCTPQEYRDYWNKKSFMMGSNILSGTNWKDGLLVIHGHNHRSCDYVKEIDSKKVRFVSWQPQPK